MARPQKSGIDYFYFSCDFFTNRKVRKIMKACGPQSVAILSCLLCNIYAGRGAGQGYYMTWDEDESTFDISDQVGVSDGAVSELVKKAIDAEFFHKESFQKFKILTSAAIQEIFFEACKRRETVQYFKKYLLIDVSEYKNAVNVDKNPVNDSGSTQSKVKETKGNESIEGSDAGASTHKSFKKYSEDDFKEAIRVANKDLNLPTKLLHQFFNYWSEKSASGLMKFQLQKTWETKRRLETWRDNQSNFEKNDKTNQGVPKPGVSGPGRSIVFDQA